MRKPKPVCNQLEWIAFFEAGGTPEVFVNVYNCQARIMVLRDGKYVDVTEEIPNGQRLAEEAVEAFGGAINTPAGIRPRRRLSRPLEERKVVEANHSQEGGSLLVQDNP